MSEKLSKNPEMARIYGDTGYFINSIIQEYGFYGQFIESMRNGGASLHVNRKTVHKTIDDQWITAVEECLPALDLVMRHRSVGIEEREEVLPIEFSRNITSRSIRHLAQHTDYISSYDGETITPSKILNVFNEETVQTYENKFVNTLIQRLYIFVDRRYSALKDRGTSESSVEMDFTSSFRFGDADGKIHLSVEASDPGDSTETAQMERVEKIYHVLATYLGSPFVRSMEGAYIRPPVMRTNAISKNKYLRQCLELWDFIESYEKLGYVLDVEEKAEKPSEAFIRDLYSMLSLQYMIFDYNIHEGFGGSAEIVASRQTDQPIVPHIVTDLKTVDTEEYNVYDTEYRRVVNVSQLSGQRRLSAGELQLRTAIDAALAADREVELLRRALVRLEDGLQHTKQKKAGYQQA